MLKIRTIKNRAEFLRIGAKRISFATSSFLMLAAPCLARDSNDVLIGYTVTKKIGNAVVRNRIKRRFRAACAEVFPQNAENRISYVLIARTPAQKITFEKLKEELIFALSKINKKVPKIEVTANETADN